MNKGLHLVLLSLFLFTLTCVDNRHNIQIAREQMKRGKFDVAFIHLENAQQAGEDPGVDALMGRLLTLRRITLHSGIHLMEKSLLKKADDSLRDDLFQIYIDMKDYDRAQALLNPVKIPLEKFFSPDMTLKRATINCMKSYSPNRLKAIEDTQIPHIKDYYAVRCLLSAPPNQKLRDDAVAKYHALSDPLIKCRLASALPNDLINDGIRKDREKCKLDFAGDLVIHREELNVPVFKNEVKDTGEKEGGRLTPLALVPAGELSKEEWKTLDDLIKITANKSNHQTSILFPFYSEIPPEPERRESWSPPTTKHKWLDANANGPIRRDVYMETPPNIGATGETKSDAPVQTPNVPATSSDGVKP